MCTSDVIDAVLLKTSKKKAANKRDRICMLTWESESQPWKIYKIQGDTITGGCGTAPDNAGERSHSDSEHYTTSSHVVNQSPMSKSNEYTSMKTLMMAR